MERSGPADCFCHHTLMPLLERNRREGCWREKFGYSRPPVNILSQKQKKDSLIQSIESCFLGM
jgi:hypothetical protein